MCQGKHCRHFWVSGRVQGVYYRATTRQQAQQLGLRGWVRNLKDGRVELIACGSEQALDQLCAWLWQGPDNAMVTDVIMQPCRQEAFNDFVVC